MIAAAVRASGTLLWGTLLLGPSAARAYELAAPGTSAPTYAVTFEQVDGQAALVVDVGVPSPALSVARDGEELVLRVGARPSELPLLPPPQAPVTDLRTQLDAGGFELRARVDVSQAFDLRHDGPRVRIVFGAAPRAASTDRGDFQALYRSLFPAPGSPSERVETEAESTPGAGTGDDGLNLGPLRLRPALMVSWVDGETTFGLTPEPLRDSYLQIEPRLGAAISAPLPRGGELRAAYEPILRTNPVLRAARGWAHQLDMSLDQPFGSSVGLRANAHLVWDVLDTVEVDPGREYFYALGRFRRDRYGAGARFKSGGRLDFDLSGTLQRVRFREPSYFFDYDRRGLLAELGYELNPNLRAGLGYALDTVPAAARRREAESRAHTFRLALYGDLAPLLDGEVVLGYERRSSPQAGPGGARFDGLTAHARLTKTFTRSTTLSLLGSRYTTLSAFETNAYYVATGAQLVLTLPLPVELSLRAGVSGQRNDYFVRARRLALPRRDTLTGWTLGLGRPLTRWSFVRADYRRDRRNSNLDEFDTRTWTFIVQVGIGWLGRSTAP